MRILVPGPWRYWRYVSVLIVFSYLWFQWLVCGLSFSRIKIGNFQALFLSSAPPAAAESTKATATAEAAKSATAEAITAAESAATTETITAESSSAAKAVAAAALKTLETLVRKIASRSILS